MEGAEAWSTGEVARMSQVTSRTLRHYDRIGLLRPASTSSSGVRWYADAELRRLQQILLYRELGLSLEAIGQVLDGQRSEVEALRRHHEWLVTEGERLRVMAVTVSRTIATLEGDDAMSAEEMFEGFHASQARWEGELVEQYGEGVRPHFETAREAVKDWTKQDYQNAAHEWDALDERAISLLHQGFSVDSPEVQAFIDVHFRTVSQFWTPNAVSYTGLGQTYVDNAEFRARFDAKDPRLAEFLRDAMAAYAQSNLT
jgi:DNA-binding transcriptional MerR regulator